VTAESSGRAFAQAVHDYAMQFTPPNKAAKGRRAYQARRSVGPRVWIHRRSRARSASLQQRLFESDDAKEGLQANLEKRKPNFSGR
jgi:enoyl-CoA hydratase/carnithine racemase